MRTSERYPFTLLAAVGFVLVAQVLTSIFLSGGHFFYALDDPYIHLELARNIFHGHYGVNVGEFAAPSSSIIWPFLLAPFSWLPWFELVPLVVNIGCCLGSVVLFERHAQIIASGVSGKHKAAVVLALLVALVLSTNILSLGLIGMEHGLQILVTAFAVLGVCHECRSGKLSWWVAGALFLGPLIRYENLAVSVPLAAHLFCRGHRLKVLVALSTCVATIGLFSVFLHALDLGHLPSSILLRSDELGLADTWLSKVGVYAKKLWLNLARPQGSVLFVMAALALVCALNRSRASAERSLALALAGSTALHLCFGSFGWMSRYELYSVTCTLMLLAYLGRDTICASLSCHGPVRAMAVASVACLPLSYSYIKTVLEVPLCPREVYAQQYQLHRLVAIYGKPVAVNDIGLVMFQNDKYVLDLWGLGSLDALAYRQAAISKASEKDDCAASEASSSSPNWMETLTKRNDVKMVAVYERWFDDIPKNWIHIADLVLDFGVRAVVDTSVAIYATTSGEVASITEALRQLEPGLPTGARMVPYVDRCGIKAP